MKNINHSIIESNNNEKSWSDIQKYRFRIFTSYANIQLIDVHKYLDQQTIYVGNGKFF